MEYALSMLMSKYACVYVFMYVGIYVCWFKVDSWLIFEYWKFGWLGNDVTMLNYYLPDRERVVRRVFYHC